MNSRLYDGTRLRWTLLGLSLAVAVVGLVLAGVCLLSGVRARAAGPYTVNSLGDARDADPNDGVCETNTPAECTLRAAIEQAQAANSPGMDTILITTTGTIALSGNLPTIAETLVISGSGSANLAIDGVNSYRQFRIGSGVEVEISGLTMSNGKAQLGEPSGGAIYNEGILTLNDVTIVGCSATGGGAIYNALDSIAIIQNGSRIGAPGASNLADYGGGISNAGTLAITGMVSYNAAHVFGGGIFNFDPGIATIVGTVSHNKASDPTNPRGSGGGVYNYQGMLIIRNSSVAYNHSNASGGGICSHGGGIGGALTMTNSTVSSNTANNVGGGIFLDRGILVLNNSTLADNIADYDNDGIGDGGGIYINSSSPDLSGVFYSQNTLIANNVDQSGDRDCHRNPPDLGIITSQGYNLVENPGNCIFAATGDITNIDPLLGPLQDNGGDTLTHALLPGSPAIDQGSCGGFTTDQRGWPRPVDLPGIPNADDGCDIGAYEEYGYPIYLPFVLKES